MLVKRKAYSRIKGEWGGQNVTILGVLRFTLKSLESPCGAKQSFNLFERGYIKKGSMS